MVQIYKSLSVPSKLIFKTQQVGGVTLTLHFPPTKQLQEGKMHEELQKFCT